MNFPKEGVGGQGVARTHSPHPHTDKGDFMSRSRSLYYHSDTGPTGPTAREIVSEIT